MTEWAAADYERISGLQQAMAEEVLKRLDLDGARRILDVGCGNGKITAEIAARRPHATVLGVDPSHEMVKFASGHYGAAEYPNLNFEVADARQLPYREEFDLVVSFNALHWVTEQDKAVQSICNVMKLGARAQLRFVGKGTRHSLEHVLEKTCNSAHWAKYFEQFQQPYLHLNLHLTPQQYKELAESHGFQILQIDIEDKSWDFKTRSAFEAFGEVTFVEWTRMLPRELEMKFVGDVLDNYRVITAEQPGEDNVFKFYQMNIRLRR